MFPGPVFDSELRTTSRHLRLYAGRSACGALLLLIIGLGYRALPQAEVVSAPMATGFARSMFIRLTVAQGVAVLAITPAIVATTIAGERSRRTLDDLLASDLTSAEIVLGKLGARLVLVLALLAAGLPILSLQTLMGGIAPSEVVIAFAAVTSIAVFVGGLSILVSVVARGPREAVFAAYGLGAFWLSLGPVLDGPMQGSFPVLYGVIEPGVRLINMANPLRALGLGRFEAVRMVAILGSAGMILAILAVLLLRRSARGLGDPPRSRRGRWRIIPRREIGDDPMWWKETQVRRPAGLVGRAVRLILVLLFACLAFLTAREGDESFRETWRYGYLADGRWWMHIHFNEFIRSVGTALYLLTLVAVTASAAGSITTEREAETWTGLVAGPLTPEEILKAKRAGVYRRTWPSIAALLALWIVGLVSGAVHPCGFLAAIVLLPPYLSAAAALGLFVSLHARSTAMAIAIALCLTIVLHGGYLLCCVPMSPETPVVAFGCSPLWISLAPISPGNMRELGSFNTTNSFYTRGGEILFAGILSVLAYTALAIALNVLSAVTFDSAADRPCRPSKAR